MSTVLSDVSLHTHIHTWCSKQVISQIRKSDHFMFFVCIFLDVCESHILLEKNGTTNTVIFES